MVKAVVSHGEIRPLEPLPADWQEGQRLRIEKAEDEETPAEEIDRDFAVLDNLCGSNEPEEEEQFERALQEARRPPSLPKGELGIEAQNDRLQDKNTDNDTKAIQSLCEAEEQESHEVQRESSSKEKEGRALPQDDAEVERRYREAAGKGNPESLFDLFMFLLERGETGDDVEAFHWLRKAADLGLVEAQIALGYRFAHGEGLPQDDVEAVHWNRKAAEQGSAEAQHELGCAYENGWGAEQDATEAIRWYTMAAKQGHAASQERLKQLTEDLCKWALTWKPHGG